MYKTITEKLFIHNPTKRVFSRFIAMLLISLLAILFTITNVKAEAFSKTKSRYLDYTLNHRALSKKDVKLTGQSIQQFLVTGKVLDEFGEPLVGITVSSSESKQTTTTNVNGDFKLEVNQSKVTLSFSGVGYKTEQIVATVGSPLEVTLLEEISSLDEVVVVGYGTVRRGDLTGSVSSVKSEDIVRSPSSNAGAGLGYC